MARYFIKLNLHHYTDATDHASLQLQKLYMEGSISGIHVQNPEKLLF